MPRSAMATRAWSRANSAQWVPQAQLTATTVAVPAKMRPASSAPVLTHSAGWREIRLAQPRQCALGMGHRWLPAALATCARRSSKACCARKAHPAQKIETFAAARTSGSVEQRPTVLLRTAARRFFHSAVTPNQLYSAAATSSPVRRHHYRQEATSPQSAICSQFMSNLRWTLVPSVLPVINGLEARRIPSGLAILIKRHQPPWSRRSCARDATFRGMQHLSASWCGCA